MFGLGRWAFKTRIGIKKFDLFVIGLTTPFRLFSVNRIYQMVLGDAEDGRFSDSRLPSEFRYAKVKMTIYCG